MQAYTDNVTGYVAGSSLITNAQCRPQATALGRSDALVETPRRARRRRPVFTRSVRTRPMRASSLSFRSRAPDDGLAARRAAGGDPRPAKERRCALGARPALGLVSGRDPARAAATHRVDRETTTPREPRAPAVVLTATRPIYLPMDFFYEKRANHSRIIQRAVKTLIAL